MALGRAYKKTDIGVIPEDWEVVPLGQLLRAGRLGGNYPNQDVEAEFRLMKMGNIARGHFDLTKVEFICPNVTPEPMHRLVRGDVLFNTRNTLDLVGKVAIWRDELPHAYYNSNLMRLEFDPEQICSNEYANATLNTAAAISRLRALATGTTSVAAIYTRDLRALRIPVPPPGEQKAIAAALGDVDALLVALDRLIAKKRDLKQAAMQQLLTGQTRLPGFSGKWETKRLGEIGWCLRGVSYAGDSDLSPHDTGQTKRLLRSNNVQDASLVTEDVQFVNSARVSQNQILKAGDILICMANGSRDLVGKAALFNVNDGHDYTFGAFMGCFRVNTVGGSSAFTCYLFQTQRYRDYIGVLLAGSSINNLTPSAIESLAFMVPSPSEQAAIATVLSDMDAELIALEQRREKTRLLKQGMMQELLTGRTRLV